MREGCGGLDGGKCLEIGTNSRKSADVWKIHLGSNVRKRISKREIVSSSLTSAGRPSNPVDVVLGFVWHIVVDDQVNGRDVQASVNASHNGQLDKKTTYKISIKDNTLFSHFFRWHSFWLCRKCIIIHL